MPLDGGQKWSPRGAETGSEGVPERAFFFSYRQRLGPLLLLGENWRLLCARKHFGRFGIHRAFRRTRRYLHLQLAPHVGSMKLQLDFPRLR